jgi:hypothetical protein
MNPSNGEIPPHGLGHVIRKILSYNMKGFSYLMEYFGRLPPTKENLLIFQISKMGFQQNYYLFKQIEDTEFYAGDEPSNEFAEAMSLDFARLEGTIVEDAKKEVDGRSLDIQELEKIASLPDNRLKESNEHNSNATCDLGTQAEFDTWYTRLYGVKALNDGKTDAQG